MRTLASLLMIAALALVGCTDSTPDNRPTNPPIGHVDCPEASGDCTGPDYV